MKSNARILGIVVVMIVCLLTGYQLIEKVKQNKALQAQRIVENGFQDDLNKLKATEASSEQVLQQASLKFYTPESLYRLYTTLNLQFPNQFVSLDLSPSYIVKNNLTWFSFSLVLKNVDPVKTLITLGHQTPALQIISFTESLGNCTIGCQGMISTSDKTFIITPELVTNPTYTVMSLVCITTSPALEAKLVGEGMLATQKDGVWYLGTILMSHVPKAMAQALAAQKAATGPVIIVTEGSRS